jgi:hypothetical protein
MKKINEKDKALPGKDYKNVILISFRFIEPGCR